MFSELNINTTYFLNHKCRSWHGVDESSKIPSLQKLAAQALGPLLPLYCAACGSEFVGKSLKSVSADVLFELTISLANNNSSSSTSNNNNSEDSWPSTTITNWVVRAIMHVGLATGIVLRGRGGASFHSFLNDAMASDADLN